MAQQFCIIGLVTLALTAGCSKPAAPTTPGQATPQAQQELEASRLFDMGRAYATQGNAVRAEQYLSLALEHGYPQEQVLPLLLDVCLSAGRLRTALKYAEPALRIAPQNYRLRYLVGAVHLALGKPHQAALELERVVETAPTYAPARYLLATLIWETFADASEAAHHYRRYLELEPRGSHAPEIVAWLREHERGSLVSATAASASSEEAR